MKTVKSIEITKIEEEINRLFLELSKIGPASDEYKCIINHIDTLNKLKVNSQKPTVSIDTVAIIAGNLLGIALILGYEKANVVTSKALGFVMKGRV